MSNKIIYQLCWISSIVCLFCSVSGSDDFVFPTDVWGTPQISGCIAPDGNIGTCVNIRQCPLLLNLLIASSPQIPYYVIDYVNQFKCGFQHLDQMVCCSIRNSVKYTDNTNVINPPPTTETPTTTMTAQPELKIHTQPPDVSNHPNVGLLPTDCGPISPFQRIIGGNLTGLFEFPWMARLEYNTRFGPRFSCGGSLINKRYVLTAAHCVTGLKNGNSLRSVRLGEHNSTSEIDCELQDGGIICAPPAQDFGIEQVIAHPGYERKFVRHDIALIRLNADVTTSDHIQPICLPIRNERNNELKKKVLVTGWGTTENNTVSEVMLKVFLPVVPNSKCSEFYKVVPITDYQICAGGVRGKDSCNGDSGGPLQLPVAHSNTGFPAYFQYGLVSFGPQTCGIENQPAVYTRIPFYMDWILDNLFS